MARKQVCLGKGIRAAYAPRVPKHSPDEDPFTVLDSVTVPDLWQQQAVSALQAGKDVVVHAPTGAGKTYVALLTVLELVASRVEIKFRGASAAES